MIMKKWNFRSYLAGIVTAVLVLGLCVPTIAATIQKQLAVTYKDIKICIDGNEITPKDANGKVVAPFISGGTTYLPVRAVGEAFGKEVAWDGTTNTVYVGQRPDDTSGITTKGTVLFETDEIKISYAGIEKRDSYSKGYDIKLQIENTSPYNYTVSIHNFSINGFMISEFFSCDVAAGKKANDEITVYGSEFEKNNISKISQVECSFYVYDSDDWSDHFESDLVTINVK